MAPATAFSQNWDGVYTGVSLGYADHHATHTFSNGAPTDGSDPDGAFIGGFLGYALQNANLVYGVEADFEGGDISGTFNNPTGGGSSGETDLNWQGSVRAKVGLAGSFGGKPTLYYGTVGWAFGGFDFQGGPPGGGFVGNGYSETLDGWTIGAGIEVALGGNISLRTEYRYTDFGTAKGNLSPGFAAVNMPVSVEQHSLRIGLRIDL
jgi:outer membrane immunogenic protein